MTRYVELPAAPKNASPVPHLTSIHSQSRRGPYGSSKYRGNCGGFLIKDLLEYYEPRSVLDLMRGSGTCRDVCRELRIPCTELEIKLGRDATIPASYQGIGRFDFIWGHPPYFRQIRYSQDPNCLSNAPSLEAFLDRMQLILRLSKGVLTRRGKIAILIGNYSDYGKYMPLSHLLVERAIREGLWMATTEIIRFQHGNTSSKKTYQSSFIPGLHDTCLIFQPLSNERN